MMAAQRHSVIIAKNVKKTIDLKPHDGQVIVFNNLDSQNVFTENELPFFHNLNKEEQVYSMTMSIMGLQKQIENMSINSEKENLHFSSILIANDEMYVVYPKTHTLMLCVVQKNKAIKIAYPVNLELNDFREMNFTSYRLKGGEETFLVAVEAGAPKNIKLIEQNITDMLQLFQKEESQLDFFHKRMMEKNPFIFVTKTTAYNDMTKWMVMFEGCNSQNAGQGFHIVYESLLKQNMRFVLECRQMIDVIEDFLTNFWNLITIQSLFQKDYLSLIRSFSLHTIKINHSEYRLPASLVSIVKYIQCQRKLDHNLASSSIDMLHKIKSIVSKEIPPICKSLQVETLVSDDLAKIKEPHRRFYAALYLSLGKGGHPDFSFRIFNDLFSNNVEMKNVFKMDQRRSINYVGPSRDYTLS